MNSSDENEGDARIENQNNNKKAMIIAPMIIAPMIMARSWHVFKVAGQNTEIN
jgi:hypothetical protein